MVPQGRTPRVLTGRRAGDVRIEQEPGFQGTRGPSLMLAWFPGYVVSWPVTHGLRWSPRPLFCRSPYQPEAGPQNIAGPWFFAECLAVGKDVQRYAAQRDLHPPVRSLRHGIDEQPGLRDASADKRGGFRKLHGVVDAGVGSRRE